MPPRDSNASFLFLVVLITGVAVAAIREGRDGSIAHGQGLSSSNALYSVSDNWRTSVRFLAAARRDFQSGNGYPEGYPRGLLTP